MSFRPLAVADRWGQGIRAERVPGKERTQQHRRCRLMAASRQKLPSMQGLCRVAEGGNRSGTRSQTRKRNDFQRPTLLRQSASRRNPQLDEVDQGNSGKTALHSQISFHQRQVAARASKPRTPVTAVALWDPMRSASQPNHRKPIGPVPMQTVRTPSIRERISSGAAR